MCEIRRINHSAEAGNAKNDDIYIRISPSQGDFVINLKSTVAPLYGKHIERVIYEVLEEYEMTGAYVEAEDYGALDFVVRARTETCILRVTEGGDVA